MSALDDRYGDILPDARDADALRAIGDLEAVYTHNTSPPPHLGAAMDRALRAHIAEAERPLPLVYRAPVRAWTRRPIADGLPSWVRWWVALLVATFSFGGGLAVAQTLPHHATPASTGGTPFPAVRAYTQAERQRAAGHCDRAIPLYQRAISSYATYVSAYVGLGFCYQPLGSYAAALATFDKAIRIDPTNYLLYFDRAGLEGQAGRMGAAIADDRAALRLSPPQVPSYLSIAYSFASFADYFDALVAMSKAIALTPSNPSLYEQRANMYLQVSEDQHAYADYRQGIRLAQSTTQRARLYTDLAVAYAGQGDYDSALGAIASAIRLQPGDAYLYVLSGNTHHEAGRLTDALSLYDRALHLVSTGPDAEAAHEGKGDVLVVQGRRTEAIGEYKRALKVAAPDDVARLNQKIRAAR